jgi:hypothetical protein
MSFTSNLPPKAPMWAYVPIKPLSRRDEFAKAAMQGLLSNNGLEPDPDNGTYITDYALAHADALIAKLDEVEDGHHN